MSYDIIYGRQFVRTGKGIIPMVLSGASNCTMFCGGREIRERDWGPLWCLTKDKLLLEEAGLLKTAEEYFGGANGKEDTCIKFRGKFMSGEDFLRFIQNGVKGALTIEEICKYAPGQGLLCQIRYEMKHTQEDEIYGRWDTALKLTAYTTQELEQWLVESEKEAAKIKNREDVASTHRQLSFFGYEPLRLGRKRDDIAGPVIVKYENRYITQYMGNQITLAGSAMDAHVFSSVEEAKNSLPPLRKSYQYVKASAVEKDLMKKYALYVTQGNRSGYYLKKLSGGSRQSLYFCRKSIDAKRFSSEREARKWFETKISYRFKSAVQAAEVRPVTSE